MPAADAVYVGDAVWDMKAAAAWASGYRGYVRRPQRRRAVRCGRRRSLTGPRDRSMPSVPSRPRKAFALETRNQQHCLGLPALITVVRSSP